MDARNCKLCNKEFFIKRRICNVCKMKQTNAKLKEKGYFNDYYKNHKDEFSQKHQKVIEQKKADGTYKIIKRGRPCKPKDDIEETVEQ